MMAGFPIISSSTSISVGTSIRDLVKLRYFVGMKLEEAAEVRGISARTAHNYWAHARAWLFRELKAKRH